MKKIRALFFAIFAVVMFFGATKAEAATARLTATADAWIDSLSPNTPHPSGDLQLTFDLLPSDQSTQLLVKFDTSSIPSGSTINSALFTLYDRGCSGATDPYITAYRETSIWVEATATWGMDLRYTTAGQANTNAAQCIVESTVNFNVKDIVQAWASGSSNYGFRVIGETGDHSPDYTRIFYGREDASMYKPYLLVDYTPPAAGSITPSGGTTGTTSGTSGNATGTSSTTGSTSNSSATATNPDGTPVVDSNNGTTNENLAASESETTSPTILDIIKNPTKIFTSSWPWWKKAIAVWAVVMIIVVIAGGVFLLARKIRKKKGGQIDRA